MISNLAIQGRHEQFRKSESETHGLEVVHNQQVWQYKRLVHNINVLR